MASSSDLQRFIDGLAAATGLDRRVIAAWVKVEGAFTPNGTGGFNFLNVRARAGGRGYSGVAESRSSGGFAKFGSVESAVRETAFWVNRMPNYAGIRAAKQKGAGAQLAAIARSPWDAGHYGGGKSLTTAYAALGGDDGKSLGDKVLGAVGDAAGKAIGDVFPGIGALPDGVLPGLPDVGGDILHPGNLLGDVAGWVTRLVLAVVVLGLAAALFYNGTRRLSGDRIPSTRDLAQLAAVAASKGAV